MKMLAADKYKFRTNQPKATRASSRTVVLVAASFILGAALSGGLYLRHVRNKEAAAGGEFTVSIGLSDSTKNILQCLESPVEIRLYSPTDTSGLSETLRSFISRVEQLLAEYDSAAAGKVRLDRCDPQTDAAAKSTAGSFGMVPSSGTDGGIYYLGITVTCGKRTEVMPQLAQEWGAALESDLSRAILRVSVSRVSATQPVSQVMSAPTPIDPSISEELLKAFPNLESQSFEDAAKILREAVLEELKAATIEMQLKIQTAQVNLAEARENKSEADKQIALKEFQRVQSEQSDKLKQITARLQERIIVLQRLKNSGLPAVPAK